jgi:streptogramin lyase
MPRFLRAFAASAASTVAVAIGSGASAQTITEFSIPTASSAPLGIAAGTDGNLWFTGFSVGEIGRITPAGVITEFPTPTTFSGPDIITQGPGGALWFTENSKNKIGRINIAGTFTEFDIPTPNSEPEGIVTGPDGALWFTETSGNKIGRITPAGSVSEFDIPTASSVPGRITAGPDGNLWFTESGGNQIGRVTTTGIITEFPVPTPNSQPVGITAGPDGALWFTEALASKIGRITVVGTVTEFTVPTASSDPEIIVTGPDGALWFTELTGNKIGRIAVSASVITEFDIPTADSHPVGIAAGSDGGLWFTEATQNQIGRLNVPGSTSLLLASTLPSSRSVQVGHSATAFATILNTGIGAAGCGILPITSVPATFSFQTTDSATNALSGTANARIPIGPNGSQSFVVAFNATGQLSPTNVLLGFDCTGVDAAIPVIGLNTLLLTFDTNPVPDVIALSATASGDGIVDIPGANGAFSFAVASINIGSSSSITVSADTGSAALSETNTICQSNPMSGACLATPAASVTTTINTNDTPTFSVFVTGAGTVPFDPANNRIFVRFRDAGGITRGSTSVAVRTQQ